MVKVQAGEVLGEREPAPTAVAALDHGKVGALRVADPRDGVRIAAARTHRQPVSPLTGAAVLALASAVAGVQTPAVPAVPAGTAGRKARMRSRRAAYLRVLTATRNLTPLCLGAYAPVSLYTRVPLLSITALASLYSLCLS